MARSRAATESSAGPHDIQPAAESIADQYARMAHAYEPRPVDATLRGVDIAISAVVLAALAPLWALVAAVVLLTSGRPVLYRGARVGRFGHIFEPQSLFAAAFYKSFHELLVPASFNGKPKATG